MSNQRELAIPLGRRIGEILEEKGDAFSYRAFGERIGMTKDTLSRIINGERYIKPSELQKICHALSITEERLKQEDTRVVVEEIETSLRKRINMKHTLTLSKKIAEVALGVTERCESLNQLGRAYFVVHQLDNAHQAFLEAYEHAKRIWEKYKDKILLNVVVSNLVLSFTARNDYVMMNEFVEEAESLLSDVPQQLGSISFSRAKLAEQQGDLEEAKLRAYQSYQYFVEYRDPLQIGIAEINIAHYEYKKKNFDQAKSFLESAITNLNESPDIQWIARKEYAKTLLTLGDRETALHVIQQSIQNPDLKKYTKVHAKFHLLHALFYTKQDLAEIVLRMEIISDIL